MFDRHMSSNWTPPQVTNSANKVEESEVHFESPPCSIYAHRGVFITVMIETVADRVVRSSFNNDASRRNNEHRIED